MKDNDRFLTAEELAAHLRVRPDTILRWAREGRIPVIRLTNKVHRYDLRAVRRALCSEQRVSSTFNLADELRRGITDQQLRLEFDERWRDALLTRQGLRDLEDDEIRDRLIEIRESVVSEGDDQ